MPSRQTSLMTYCVNKEQRIIEIIWFMTNITGANLCHYFHQNCSLLCFRACDSAQLTPLRQLIELQYFSFATQVRDPHWGHPGSTCRPWLSSIRTTGHRPPYRQTTTPPRKSLSSAPATPRGHRNFFTVWYLCSIFTHDDVIKWKHFPRNWPFVPGIHRSPVNSPHKGQWRGTLMFSLICVWINDWINNREAGDLRRYRVHYDVIVMR